MTATADDILALLAPAKRVNEVAPTLMDVVRELTDIVSQAGMDLEQSEGELAHAMQSGVDAGTGNPADDRKLKAVAQACLEKLKKAVTALHDLEIDLEKFEP